MGPMRNNDCIRDIEFLATAAACFAATVTATFALLHVHML